MRGAFGNTGNFGRPTNVSKRASSPNDLVSSLVFDRYPLRSAGLVQISAIGTFQKVVKATHAIPPVPKRLEHDMMLSPLVCVAVVFG